MPIVEFAETANTQIVALQVAVEYLRELSLARSVVEINVAAGAAADALELLLPPTGPRAVA